MTWDLLIKVFQIFATIAFGFAALIVSCQQLKIAKIKQRLELYDRRLVIIKSTEDFIARIIHAEFKTQDVVSFSNSISEAKFLFGADVNNYLMKIKDSAFEVDMMNISMAEERQKVPVAGGQCRLHGRPEN